MGGAKTVAVMGGTIKTDAEKKRSGPIAVPTRYQFNSGGTVRFGS